MKKMIFLWESWGQGGGDGDKSYLLWHLMIFSFRINIIGKFQIQKIANAN